MHLLYLDDSGSVPNRDEKYFVLGGICVPEMSLRWLSHKLDELAGKIDPDAPGQVEFHAAEIYSGREAPWNHFKKKMDRVDIIKRVLLTLEDAFPEIVIFACAIHKDSYPGQDPVIMAFEDISSRFDMHLHNSSTDKTRQHGLIVIDKSSYEFSLQNLTRRFRAEGNRWGSYLRGICEVPLFVDSRSSRIIQLADHIAYAVFRRYNADDLTYFNCIESRFYQDNGVMHGLAHLQKYNDNCTCPACLTRRNAK